MLSTELRRARLGAGLTQEVVAARAKVTREYVGQLERGLKSPTVDVLLRLCKAMGVSAGQLLSRVEKASKTR